MLKNFIASATCSVVMIFLAALMFTSCERDFLPTSNSVEVVSSNQEMPATKASTSNSNFGWTYFPNHSLSYSASSSGETKPGYGGTYNGGHLKATFIDDNGSYYVRISKLDGGSFSSGGNAYVKVGSLYGSYGSNHASYSEGDTHVDVPVTITLDKNNTSNLGVMNLWPMTISSSNYRSFTYPILIWTDPLCNYSSQTNYLQGYVDNVPVKEVPKGCVAFCKAYYNAVFGKNLANMGNAGDWYKNAGNYGLTFYANGTTIPQVGDIVCWTGGSNNLGHVAIIFEVQGNKVKIAHQGRLGTDPIGKELKRSGTNGQTLVNTFNSLTLKGVIRRTY